MGNRKFATDFFNQAVASVNDQFELDARDINHAYQLFSSACLTDPDRGAIGVSTGTATTITISISGFGCHLLAGVRLSTH